MVETTKIPGDKTLSVAPTKTLTLKLRGVEQGVVKQSFSHGRTKAVVVEKVKRRVGGPTRTEAPPTTSDGLTAKRSGTARPSVVAPVAAPATVPAQAPAAAPKPSGVVLRTLTEDDQKARVHALADARLREAEERKIAEEEAHVRVAREAAERTERDAAEARKRGEEDRRRHDEETKRKAELEAKKRFGEGETTAARPAIATPSPRKSSSAK
jgi:translation initiation factor IF-2